MADLSIEKVYDPKKVEERIYAFWQQQGLFHGAPAADRKPYAIVIPPPNVTSRLHMGHAYNNTIQDMIIRFKKMMGFETMWMPGTDHAGIATQTVVERHLAKTEGKTRYDVGRERFVERVWEWKEENGQVIIDQLKKLGCACDWERERFTMDEGLSHAVQEVFIQLYEKGLIYKGQRIVNWDPASATALADDEVDHREIQGKLYHIRYRFKDSDEWLVVATTRPETLLGDTAVAVSPDDPEKKGLVGRTVVIPIVERDVPIIADPHVDKEFGSGFVKVTPAHDPNDFEIGRRHELDQVIMLDRDGRIHAHCKLVRGRDVSDELPIPAFLAGEDRFEARKRIVEALETAGQIEKIEPYTHSVGHSYRSHVPIEPYLSEQWFVKMEPLAKPALQAVRDGRIKLYPEGRYDRTYEHWMTNIRDWCISRQLWWGHRIPAWYNEAGEIRVSREDPSTADEKWEQDPDVLDTWFSSQLWPFSTLGWPEKTPDLDYFYPTNTLVTGSDIIFFWVARMIMAGLEFMGDIPFENVYFNGIVRDEKGRKMSKSLGNGIDPLEMISEFSADAVRYTLLSLSSEGNDINLSTRDFEIGRNFTNKLWNAFRFLGMSLDTRHLAIADADGVAALQQKGLLDLADRWILSRMNSAIEKVSISMEQFKFHEAVGELHQLFWREYCDWYLELIKPRLYGENAEERDASLATATFVLRNVLRMLHPLIPFITEEVWQHIGREVSDSILATPWPAPADGFDDNQAEEEMDLLQAAITAVRTIRGEMNVPNKKDAELIISGADARASALFDGHRRYFSHLARINALQIGPELARPELAASSVVRNLELYVPLAGLIDVTVETNRLRKEKERLEKQVGGLKRKLSNEDFLTRAPKHVVENEKNKLQDFEDSLVKVDNNLQQLTN